MDLITQAYMQYRDHFEQDVYEMDGFRTVYYVDEAADYDEQGNISVAQCTVIDAETEEVLGAFLYHDGMDRAEQIAALAGRCLFIDVHNDISQGGRF